MHEIIFSPQLGKRKFNENSPTIPLEFGTTKAQYTSASQKNTHPFL